MDALADAVHGLHVQTDVGVEHALVQELDEQLMFFRRHVHKQLETNMLKAVDREHCMFILPQVNSGRLTLRIFMVTAKW